MNPRRPEVADSIRRRLFSALHLGLVKRGGRLASVRELAHELGVDRRVVLAAYRMLEHEGLVELRHRSGIFVAPTARLDQGDGEQTDWVVEILMHGLVHGLPAGKMSEGLQRSLETLRLNAVVLECNDDQLYSVPAELRRDYGFEVTALDVDSLQDGTHPSAALRRADLLVTTPFHRTQVERLARRLDSPKLVITMCTDLFTAVGQLLPVREVYFVVADPRMAAKLHRVFDGAPGGANLRTLVVGRDDLSRIPEQAPTYLTQLARLQVGDGPLLHRVWAEARIFSVESSRQLLSFIVRSNLQALAGLKRA